jgi:hypothetical protein
MKYGNINTQGTFKGDDQYLHPSNLLLNGNFEYWYAGTSSAPDGWTLSSGQITREGTVKKISSYSVKGGQSGEAFTLYQDIHTVKGISYWQNRKVTFSCWVWCDTGNTSKLTIDDGISSDASSYHTGGSSWELLTITKTINGSATQIRLKLETTGTSTVDYYDGAMAVEGSVPFVYSEHPEDHLYKQLSCTISYISVMTGASDDNRNGIINADGRYSYNKNINQYVFFPLDSIPPKIGGHPTIIDECIIYYNTQANGDYISTVGIIQEDGDGTSTTIVNHGDDLGNGSNGNESHNVIDTSIEMADKSGFIYAYSQGMDTNTDVRIYSFVFKVHAKVHG